MRQIVSPIVFIQKILGQQKLDKGTPCRLTAHCVRMERPEGVLLYHTLTGELLLLSPEEAAALEGFPCPVPPALWELAARWFLVPVGLDDMALANQTRQIAERLMKKEAALTKYSIFTTTACNARCFYCFEEGWKTVSMKPDTALDTAKYIAAHRGNQSVYLRWFGGEPLVNTQAIDVITGYLRQNGVEFRSLITSNGFLFDEALVQRARDAWNLQEANITLDGTETVYNQRKAFVNPKGSPYRRVLGNIGLLLDAGIQVRVRLNMDRDNENDLCALMDQLADRFGGKTGFGVYLVVLRENTGVNSHSYTEEERRYYAEELRSMQLYAEKKGIAFRERLTRGLRANACLGDNVKATTIMPGGQLSRCEDSRDGAIWGSIYSEEADEEVLQRWRERKPPEAACRVCAVYPQCIRLKKCPSWLEHCSPIEQMARENKLRCAVLGAYEDWKNENPETV